MIEATSTSAWSGCQQSKSSDHRDDGVGQFRLAGELGLRHRRHADHRVPGRPCRRETRRARRIADPACRRRCRPARGVDAFGQGRGKATLRLRRRRGRDSCAMETCATQAIAEEGRGAPDRAVDELVGDNEGAGREVLTERAAGGNRYEIGDADLLQGVDVGAIVDAVRGQAMAAPVTRQKHRLGAADPAEREACRTGHPKGSKRSPRVPSARPGSW